MKKLIIIVIASVLFSTNAFADTDITAEKRALIDTLLEQTGQTAAAVGQQFSDVYIQQMTQYMRQTQPDLDPRGFDIVEEEIKNLIHEEIVVNGSMKELMYPIYDRHFNESELKQMIELNKTELGQKMIQVMPLITQEGMLAGQQFGQNLAPKIQERITTRFQEEGIK